jgi:CubicO group peptidase (beta-lactamase class C family)
VAEATSRLGALQLVNPHLAPGGGLGSSFAVVDAAPAVGATSLAGASGPLAVEVAGAGRLWDLESWNAVTHGTSLLVLVEGSTVHEWYADGLGPHDLFLGASMTKSALAHLVGLAVTRASLRLDDEVVRHVPELRGTGYDGCTVLDVATMTGGVDWVEDHRDPRSAASRLTACFGGQGGDSRALLTTLGRRGAPGTRWEYCTADSQVLDWVRERATGATYVEALGELWQLLGCADDAVVGTDAVGVPMAGGSLAATARDWARLGMLQVDGRIGGRRLLDAGWLERSCRPSRSFTRPGRLPSSITTHAGFGAHWWPLDDGGRRVTADGSRGQFTYVDRDLDVVVVKTSRWPYEDFLVDRQLRDLSYLGLPEVAAAAAVTTVGPSA